MTRLALRACVYLCSHFQTSYLLKPLGGSKSNFMRSIHGMRRRKFANMAYIITMPIYNKIPSKIFFSRTENWYVVRGALVNHIYI